MSFISTSPPLSSSCLITVSSQPFIAVVVVNPSQVASEDSKRAPRPLMTVCIHIKCADMPPSHSRSSIFPRGSLSAASPGLGVVPREDPGERREDPVDGPLGVRELLATPTTRPLLMLSTPLGHCSGEFNIRSMARVSDRSVKHSRPIKMDFSMSASELLSLVSPRSSPSSLDTSMSRDSRHFCCRCGCNVLFLKLETCSASVKCSTDFKTSTSCSSRSFFRFATRMFKLRLNGSSLGAVLASPPVRCKLS
mmetsp:Transcript_5197/g.19029  ORF Transcript_5197/g.19029 Transcript_5197/m.19029 type:complete len:251 (-) Transcript_5197:1811-2563(-)